ncbi:hypothetical protein GGQ84_001139 [Desulfitispora alkaliphila]|uniref:peptidoglycan editing factor PgeF n=1 Tax=Desulfitispora alkaliphila TaxID=622674 RepID=UPI003D211F8B
MRYNVPEVSDMKDGWSVKKTGKIECVFAKNLLNFDNITHGFSTRYGGVSQKPYESLNLGIHTPDDNNRVIRNRKIFTESLGINLQDCVTAEQVHSNNIYIVGKADRGKGITDYSTAVPETDALLTATSGVGLMMFFADCIPIILFDPINKVIAIAHGGWRGTVENIVQKTIVGMIENFNSKPKDIFAAIGPGIGKCCYEVDNRIINKIPETFIDNYVLCQVDAEKYKLDLKLLNYKQLLSAGILSKKISLSSICTSSRADLFFSHRRDKGKSGRMGALIMLK